MLPLALAFEHRNYLPSLGPLLVLCYYLPHPGMNVYLPVRRALLPVLAVLCVFVTWPRADAWGRGLPDLQLYELRHNPDSPQLHSSLATFYGFAARVAEDNELRERSYRLSVYHMERCSMNAVNPTYCLLMRYRLAKMLGRPVPARLLLEAERHLRSARRITTNLEPLHALLRGCAPASGADCPAPRDQLYGLVDALVQNPYYTPYMKVVHQLPLIDYYTRGRLWPERSWEMLRELRRTPVMVWADLEVRLALINWLLAVGMEDVARDEWLAVALGHPIFIQSHDAKYVHARFPRPIAP